SRLSRRAANCNARSVMKDERIDIDRPGSADFGPPPWTSPEPLPPAALPAASEIVVIGAGVTGLAAALTAAEGGHRVTVIERRFGSGATARSGGIVLGDTLAGPTEGFDGCELALRDWIAQSGAACDLYWEGCLELARDASLPSDPI